LKCVGRVLLYGPGCVRRVYDRLRAKLFGESRRSLGGGGSKTRPTHAKGIQYGCVYFPPTPLVAIPPSDETTVIEVGFDGQLKVAEYLAFLAT
jgi:hypothetical protein